MLAERNWAQIVDPDEKTKLVIELVLYTLSQF